MPLFYFGDLVDEDHDQFRSLIPPIQCMSESKDQNNNQLFTAETLLSSSDHHENAQVTQAYRQLFYKMRFLGRTLHTDSIPFLSNRRLSPPH